HAGAGFDGGGRREGGPSSSVGFAADDGRGVPILQPGQTANVAFDDGRIYELSGVDLSMIESRGGFAGREEGDGSGGGPLLGGRLISGRTKLRIPRGSIAYDAEIDLGGHVPRIVEEGRPDPSEGAGRRRFVPGDPVASDVGSGGAADRANRPSGPINHRTRGVKKVLAVRVVAGDGSSYGGSEEHLGDRVFGNGRDEVNLASQMRACSHGQLDLIKADDRLSHDAAATAAISDGVVTIRVSALPSGGHGAVRNAVTDEIVRLFGAPPRELAHHVLYCMPPNVMRSIAYAYVDSWMSVYSDGWCDSVSAQMREFLPFFAVFVTRVDRSLGVDGWWADPIENTALNAKPRDLQLRWMPTRLRAHMSREGRRTRPMVAAGLVPA
ncbi:hypothetical protein ACHAWF_003488, partial [Thalassiosira exigua]